MTTLCVIVHPEALACAFACEEERAVPMTTPAASPTAAAPAEELLPLLLLVATL